MKEFSQCRVMGLLAIFLFFCGANAQSIRVQPRWNLLSLPAKVDDGRKTMLFPSAVSGAFVYDKSYRTVDILEHGGGFWLKFDKAETIFIPGENILADTITVHAGWNLVGSLSSPIAVTGLQSEPANIIISVFSFIPNAGYRQADFIQPGVGYWVKVNQPGTLFLSTNLPMGQPCAGKPTVEYAGKIYHTVQIGTQCWLKENLNVGSMLNGSQDASDNGAIEKYCYNDDPANCATYGGLYQWDETMQYDPIPGIQGICPDGWHVPSLADFQTLSEATGNNSNALKATGQGTEDGAGSNTSGFSALLGGYRHYSGGFYGIGYFGIFWGPPPTQDYYPYYPYYPYYLYLNYRNGSVNIDYDYPTYGTSVRCIENSGSIAPSDPIPGNGENAVTTSPTLSWACNDTGNVPLGYTVYWGFDDHPAWNISGTLSAPRFAMSGLEYRKTYYWRVAAIKNQSSSTVGPVWKFTTKAKPASIFAVGRNGTILHALDNDIAWSNWSSQSMPNINDIGFNLWNIAFAACDSGVILSTQDTGRTWTSYANSAKKNFNALAIPSTYANNPISGISPMKGSKIGWVVGDSGMILTTLDVGKSWNTIQSKTKQNLRSIAFCTLTDIWVCGDSGTVLHSTTAGRTWVAAFVAQPVNFKSIYIDCGNGSNDSGWVVGENGAIYHIWGATPTFTPPALPDTSQMSTPVTNATLRGVICIHSREVWAVGDNGTVIHTSNAGLRWTLQPTPTLSQLNAIRFSDSLTGWAFGNDGAIIHTTDGGNHWALQSSGTSADLRGGAVEPVVESGPGNNQGIPGEPFTGLLKQHHAKPDTSDTIFSYHLSQTSQVHLSIVDMTDREVRTLVSEIQQPGEKNVQIDTSGLPGGLYFYQMDATGVGDPANHISRTRKMVLVR